MGKSSIEIIAHRGFAAHFPENTLPALEGALDAGASSLEWDVQVTADGVPVLIHDDDLDRTSDGRGPVHTRTSAELSRLDAGSWLAAEFAGTRIPTLAETLARLGGRVDRIYPEVKSVRSDADLDSILRILRESGLHPRTVLISLNHVLLEKTRARDPEIHLGWVVDDEEDLDRCARIVVDDGRAILDPAARLLLKSPGRTREMVAAGIPLATWTVDEPDEAQSLLDLGVRRITTNQVARLVSWARGAEVEGLES
jgi:glycerophosphoryl diester phosphodiesterase